MARLVRLRLIPFVVEDAHVIAWHRLRRRPGFYRKHPEANTVRNDRPPGLRLPPVIDHGNLEPRFGPTKRVRVTALAGQEQCPHPRQVVPPNERPAWILLLDRAEARGRREQHIDAMLLAYAPERARIWCADGFSLVQNARGAFQ